MILYGFGIEWSVDNGECRTISMQLLCFPRPWWDQLATSRESTLDRPSKSVASCNTLRATVPVFCYNHGHCLAGNLVTEKTNNTPYKCCG
jgi:hypothetical protein